MKITLSVDGGAPQTFDYASGAVARPDFPGDVVAGLMQRNGTPNFSPNMAAGATFSLSLVVSENESAVAAVDFGAAGSLGGSRKTVTVEKDGVVVPIGPPEQNAGNATVGLNNPTAPNNLAPGVWLVKVLFADPGAAVVTISA